MNHTTIRLGIWISIALFAIICLSSCATRYVQCDAYGQVDNTQEVVNQTK
jgi:hypothetical protein